MLEQAQISSNGSFIKLENFEFEYLSSTKFKENEPFQFKLEIRDKFAEVCRKHFEYFKFYGV